MRKSNITLILLASGALLALPLPVSAQGQNGKGNAHAVSKGGGGATQRATRSQRSRPAQCRRWSLLHPAAPPQIVTGLSERKRGSAPRLVELA
ncbi:MAG: hypothetical protein KJZ80_10645 [Hyphomicrobiaceae bacterium]|nr:hypothetical protein [Hyphomicrobiaceae bacterium]